MNWQKEFPDNIKINEPLRDKTTFKIGGPAKFFLEPKSMGDLKRIVILARNHKMPILVLGRGSNVLVNDAGVKGIILRLNSSSFKKVFFKKNHVEAGSGLDLKQLIQETRRQGLSGMEFLTGIPGTVGGALAMNAGAWGKNIGDLVKAVKVMDYKGKLKILRRNQIKFGYRKSGLAKYIILGARFNLVKEGAEKIIENLNKYLAFRRNSQDNSFPNAGCIFKNPNGKSAGKLIDLCGLKGRSIKDAFVSGIHANFILNRGSASAKDVLKLINLVRKEVKKKFKVTLEPEIKIWG
jgi:UDP-N-acetylmuramate dehydrogenase